MIRLGSSIIVAYPVRNGNFLQFPSSGAGNRIRTLSGYDTHNIGFIGPDKRVYVYDTGECSCLTKGLDESGRFLAYTQPTDRRRTEIRCCCLDGSGNLIFRHLNMIAAEIENEQEIGSLEPIKVRTTHPQKGENVFTQSLFNGVWWPAYGEITAVAKKNGNYLYVTDIPTYHGSCGALLYDIEGSVLAFGAKVSYLAEDEFDGITRDHDYSAWDSLVNVL